MTAGLGALGSLFLPGPRPVPTYLTDGAPGVLTEDILRKAFDDLWAGYTYSPMRNRIPVLRRMEDITRGLAREEANREAWIRGVKARLGLVCAGDEP